MSITYESIALFVSVAALAIVAVTAYKFFTSGKSEELKKFLGETNYNLLMSLGKTAVLAVEQMSKQYGWLSDQKLEEASKWLAEQAKIRGIDIDEKTIRWVIESNVFLFFRKPAN